MSESRKIALLKSEQALDPEDGRMIVLMTKADLRMLIREEMKMLNGNSCTDLLTPQELADKLQIPVTWVYEQSRLGNIPTHRIGRYIRFELSAVLTSQKQKNL